MNTIQINNAFKKVPEYIGTFPLDYLPKTHRRPCALICNYDKSNKPGSHWVAIILNREGTGEFFDSFGLPPLKSKLHDFLIEQCPRGYTFNHVALQHPFGNACGRYCIIYLKLRLAGQRMEEILQLFTPDTRRNDKRVNTIEVMD